MVLVNAIINVSNPIFYFNFMYLILEVRFTRALVFQWQRALQYEPIAPEMATTTPPETITTDGAVKLLYIYCYNAIALLRYCYVGASAERILL